MLAHIIRSSKLAIYLHASSRDQKVIGITQKKLKRCVKDLEIMILDYGLKNLNIDWKCVKTIEITINLCGLYKIRELNKTFRKKDSVTDVISLQMHDYNKKKVKIPYLILGDVFVCCGVAVRQAQASLTSIDEEILSLIIHGILHLCGFDHEKTSSERKKMYSIEERFLAKICKRF